MAAQPQPQPLAPAAVLPEAAAVHWRPRVDERRLRRVGALWTLTTFAHVVPFTLAAAGLMALHTIRGEIGTHAPLEALGCIVRLREGGQIVHASNRRREIPGIAQRLDLIGI